MKGMRFYAALSNASEYKNGGNQEMGTIEGLPSWLS